MKRALVILLGALLLMLALAAGSFAFLAATESGTRFLTEQAERFLPVRFTGVSGALWGEVGVERLEVALDERTLTIDELSAAMDIFPLLFDNRLDVAWARAARVTLSGGDDGAGEGGSPTPLELPYMPIGLDVAALEIEHLALPGAFPMAIDASAAWHNRGLQVRSLELTSDVVNVTLEGRLGRGANPTMEARVLWSLPDGDWRGEGTLDGPVDRLAVYHELHGLVSATGRGTGSLADPGDPRVDLAVALEDLEFDDVRVDDIQGRLAGTLAQMTARADARVTTAGLAPFQARVEAEGPVTGPLTLTRVTADALDGRQQARGRVSWSEGVEIMLAGDFEEVSLEALRQDLEGRVAANFRFRYQRDDLALALDQVSGTLNGLPVAGAVDLAQLEDGWAFDPVRLEVGENRAAGRLTWRGERLELTAEINAPALGVLGLPVTGDARGTVELAGQWPALDGRIDLHSSGLEAFDTAFQAARVQVSVNQGVVNGALRAERVSRNTAALADSRLELSGPLENVSWQLSFAGGDASGAFRRVTGGFVLGVSGARLTALERTWRLDSATQLSIDGEGVRLAPVCILGTVSRACVDAFSYHDGSIETRGELVRAPLGLFEPWLPVRFADGGYLEGQWTVAGNGDDWQGTLRLYARELAYLVDPEEPPVDLPDLLASGTIEGEALTVLLTATDRAFSLIGEGRLSPIARDGELTGTLSASVADISPLRVFDQRIETLTGALNGRIDITGTLARPRAQGELMLSDSRVALNQPDLVLDGMNARLALDDSGRFEFEGRAEQRDSEVRLTGNGEGLFGGELAFQAALNGEPVHVEHPDWEMRVSPELTLQYAEGQGRVRGRVVVPEAEVRMKTLPTSVPNPSADVVVVGREEEPAPAANGLRVDVDLVLGEDVRLKALALTAELEGTLRARVDARGRTTLRGTLDVTGGVLSTQGTTLAIESGSVVYNGPVTRPYIDVRAVRLIEDVTPEVKVGLHIRGDADNLTTSVFSEPPMSDTRALSFLVLGRDIDQERADDDSGQLMAAAINLGLARSSGVVKELRNLTGLDELSAMAEAQNSFAIVAGKRVSDDLYVRYTYNTLSAVGAFLVRYDLGSRWHLEAQSGEASSMDLMYSFEK